MSRWIIGIVSIAVVGGAATATSGVSVAITQDNREVQADLTFNGVAESDSVADTGNPFADLAEVLVADEARSRATQLSSYRDLDADTYAIRSRNRVGYETLRAFGAGDTAEGASVSAFSVTFDLDQPLAYDLLAIGSVPAEAGSAIGGYAVRLAGVGVDITFDEDVLTEQRATGMLEPGTYLFSVTANVSGSGAARLPFEVDGRLILSAVPTPVIPTPAAGLAGLALLVGAAGRRRR